MKERMVGKERKGKVWQAKQDKTEETGRTKKGQDRTEKVTNQN